MGNGTLTNWFEKLGIHLTDAEGNKPVRLGFDWILLLIVIGLVIFGLVMVYSASADFSFTYYGTETYTILRQVVFAIVGLIVMGVLAVIPYQFLKKISFWLLVASVIGLALLFTFGESRLGAIRGGPGGSIQPSEAAKLIMVIYLASWLASHKDDINSLQLGIIPLGVALGVVFVLIILQPDLSAALTIVIIGGLMWFLAGGGGKQAVLLFLLALLGGYAVVMWVPQGRERFANFWYGWTDLLRTSDHVQKGLMAFMNGGWLGVGVGKGQVKLLGLPFPQTDSIFAVVGEETGFLGSIVLILAYLGILWRGIHISRHAPDRMGKLLAAGLTFWVLFEATLNMSVMLGILPFAGQALPFISAGGSSLLACLAAVGIILNVSHQAVKAEVVEERKFDAVVDLRRRNWRRRVPRTVHSASPGVWGQSQRE